MAKLFLGNVLRKNASRSPRLLKLLWGVEAALIGGVAGLGRLISPDRASALGRSIMRRVGPHLDKNRVFKRNLQVAFPEKSDAQIDTLLREIWGNLGAVMGEYPHLRTICLDEAAQRLEIVHNGEVLRPDGRAVVFATAHLSNWEVAPGAVRSLGIDLTGVYTPLQNPWLNRIMCGARDDLGLNMVTREGAVRQLVRQLKRGKSVGLLVDQRVDSGEPVPFFGHDMLTSTTPAELALRMGCDLIPVQVQRLDGARFRVTFHAPVRADDEAAQTHDKALQMTHKLNVLFESWIRERPQDWLCSKRRWPKNIEPRKHTT